MLEFLDGLLRGGKARLPAVTEKLREIAEDQGIDLDERAGGHRVCDQDAPRLSAPAMCCWRSCSALLAMPGPRRCCCRPPSPTCRYPAGLARMLADDGPGDVPFVTAALAGSRPCRCCTVSPTARCGCTAGPRKDWPVSSTPPPIAPAASAPAATGCGGLITKPVRSTMGSRPCAISWPDRSSTQPFTWRWGCSKHCANSSSPWPLPAGRRDSGDFAGRSCRLCWCRGRRGERPPRARLD